MLLARPPAHSKSGSPTSVSWSWTPPQSSNIHYQMDLNGVLTPNAICAQNAVSGQPANTCVVAFIGATTCYM